MKMIQEFKWSDIHVLVQWSASAGLYVVKSYQVKNGIRVRRLDAKTYALKTNALNGARDMLAQSVMA